MSVVRLLSSTLSFIKFHRVVALIIVVIVAGSVFSVYMLLRDNVFTPSLTNAPRHPTKVSIAPVLPPKPLAAWGEDPFKDVVREMEIAREKEEAAAAAEAAEKARIEAEKEAARIAAEEAARKARQEEIDRELAAQKEREKKEKEREHRKKVIQSIRIDGIGSGRKPSESFAIIQGKPYKIRDTVVKNGVEAVIKAIEQNVVVFRDPISNLSYRVPLSR